MLGLDTWGLDVVLWFQNWRTPPIESLVLFFHEMGQLLPYMLLLPIFFWCVDRRFGARLAAWFVAGVYLNSQLKVLFGLLNLVSLMLNRFYFSSVNYFRVSDDPHPITHLKLSSKDLRSRNFIAGAG